MNTWAPDALPPGAAVQRLAAGNLRFREGRSENVRTFNPALATANQRPFAVIIGCSDSRTPVEIVFDQGFGDLFVARVAGHVVAPSVIGTAEFACSQFGTRLVVVLGHTRCGAVTATLRAIETGNGPDSKHIRAITERIAPYMENVPKTGEIDSRVRLGVRANVRAAADHLRHGSRLLEDLVLANRVAVVGAEYDLDTGIVHFLDEVRGE